MVSTLPVQHDTILHVPAQTPDHDSQTITSSGSCSCQIKCFLSKILHRVSQAYTVPAFPLVALLAHHNEEPMPTSHD